MKIGNWFLLVGHKAEVDNHNNTQNNSVPAKYFKVVMLDVVQQESNGEVRNDKRYEHSGKQNCGLQAGKGATVAEVLINF